MVFMYEHRFHVVYIFYYSREIISNTKRIKHKPSVVKELWKWNLSWIVYDLFHEIMVFTSGFGVCLNVKSQWKFDLKQWKFNKNFWSIFNASNLKLKLKTFRLTWPNFHILPMFSSPTSPFERKFIKDSILAHYAEISLTHIKLLID